MNRSDRTTAASPDAACADPIDAASTGPAATDSAPHVDPDLSIPELERRITELAGHLNAAQHRFLLLIAQFDRRGGWHDGATRTCAHWLNWKCGIDLGAAREKVRVAHALADLPRISASMAAGELSYSKVRALTRVASAETEEDLLMIAQYGTAEQVERLVRGFRRAQEAEELGREARQFAGRQVSWYQDEDGALVLKARLPAEAGAVLVKAFEVATEASWRDEARAQRAARGGEGGGSGARRVSAETSGGGLECDNGSSGIEVPVDDPLLDEPRATLVQRRADALVAFAEGFLKQGPAGLRGGERQTIVVHIDADALGRGAAAARAATADPASRQHAPPGPHAHRCELEHGPALALETARRLACDASLVTLTEDALGRPLDVGRKTRTIAPSLGRALRARDRGCRFPGCGATQFIDGHHIEHWADGGATRLDNLVLLCRFHHRQVHEGNVRVQRLDDGALRFFRADDHRAFGEAVPMAGSTEALVEQHRRHGLAITPDTAVSRWCGERLDLAFAVSGLCAISDRAANRDRAVNRDRAANGKRAASGEGARE